MPQAADTQFTLEQRRSVYSDELRIVAGLESPDLVSAFARVPRELYLGAPPWGLSSGSSLRQNGYRATSNVDDLYHDVFVALRSETYLNNGQPSIVARWIDALKLATGKRVLHCGCGTGYYTAIMAEMVEAEGDVVAIEIDPMLSRAAISNLAPYRQVTVLRGDVGGIDPPACDAILVNAGVTHPHPGWLGCLSEGGVLVMPLSVGRSLAINDALVIAFTRRDDRFAAELLSITTIYPSPSLRDPQLQRMLNESFESHAMLRLRSARTDEHDPDNTCIVHTAGFCLSAAAI